MPRGWLLDVTSSRAGDSVLLWLKEMQGMVHRVEVPYAPPFYVTGEPDRLHALGEALDGRRDVASVAETAIQSSPFEAPDVRHAALAVTPQSHGRRRSLATEIDALGACVTFRLFDVDLTASQLYYLEHDLYPCAPVSWSGQHVVALEPPETWDYVLPPFRTSELAVEVVGQRPGRPPRSTDPIARVRIGTASVEGVDETATLAAVVEELRAQAPDVLWTRGGDTFDVPHLYHRALVAGFTEEEFVLGREPMPFGLDRAGSTFVSYGRIYHRSPSFALAGRFHIDLDERFVEDVTMVGFLDVARFSRLGLQTVARQSPGTAFSAMEVATARAQGVHIPWKKNLPECPKSAALLIAADRGGFTLTPPVGLFEGVDEFDFVSLYPSIMVHHNLSLETLECPCCPDSPHVAPGLGYRSCTIRDGLVPRTLRPILERRLYFKRRKRETTGAERTRYEDLAKAWKWVLVTSFGYQGYRNAKFGRIECHEAINAYAREILADLATTAQREGWTVLHGIVDSVWLKPPADADPEAFARRISAQGHLPLGYEGRYRWIVFLPDKAYGLGVAQRYYGLYEDGEFKVRGIELRRGDTCGMVRGVQERVLKVLSQVRSAAEFQRAIPEALALGHAAAAELAQGGWSREELVLTHGLSHRLEEYRTFSPGVAALRQLKEHGITREPGEEVGFLLADRRSQDWRRRAVAAELMTGSESYDAAAYIELLARSFETLFSPFGYTLERVARTWGHDVQSTTPPRAFDRHSLERPGQRRLTVP
ncbi:MAG: hypothetical protein L3K03_00040 [Thermoplasmata archaeon]|nr:hypothetical protein [Thermoplasmata archaeon]